MLSTVVLLSATAFGFGLLYTLVFPRLSMLECVAGAAPLGLTLSAWLALLLKSLVFRRCEGLSVFGVEPRLACS